MAGENKIKVRLRLIIIKNNKILLTQMLEEDYYYFTGGKLEFRETLEEGCQREIKEECGEDTEFKMQKILYVRDFLPEEKPGEHSVEFYILGTINKFLELDHQTERDHLEGDRRMEWKDLANLPDNLYPKELVPILKKDFKEGFKRQGVYVGKIK